MATPAQKQSKALGRAIRLLQDEIKRLSGMPEAEESFIHSLEDDLAVLRQLRDKAIRNHLQREK